MEEMMLQIDQQMKEVPAAVQVWMNWMMGIFLASVLFVWKNKTARWALATIILSMPIVMIIFHLSGTVHLFGIAHFVLWLPLLIYILKNELKTVKATSLYGIWLYLLSATIMISLAFDARDIVFVFLDMK